MKLGCLPNKHMDIKKWKCALCGLYGSHEGWWKLSTYGYLESVHLGDQIF